MFARNSAGMVTHTALALLVYAVSVPAVATRWRVVLHAVTGRKLPLGTLMLASLASSFVNNVTAGPAGEACRVIALVRLRFATASRATAAIVYERLSELPAVALMLVAAVLVFARGPLNVTTAIVSAAIAALAWPLLRRMWTRLRHRAGIEVATIEAVPLLRSTLWSMAIWTLDVARIWLIAAGFQVQLTIPQAAALSGIAVVGGLAPTIGGLGVIEGGLIAALLACGVPSAAAIGITAVERSISYGLATVAGAGALAVLGGRELWTAARSEAAGAAG